MSLTRRNFIELGCLSAGYAALSGLPFPSFGNGSITTEGFQGLPLEVITEYLPDFLPAYVSDGMIGMRVGKNPFFDGTATVNGFVGTDKAENVEAFAPAIYPLATDIRIENRWLSHAPHLAKFKRQQYDFSNGELLTEFDYTFEDYTANIQVLTFCCRSLPNLVAQEIIIKTNKSAELTIRAKLSADGLNSKILKRETPTFPSEEKTDGIFLIESLGALSQLGAAYYTEFTGQEGVQLKRNENGYQSQSDLSSEYSFMAEPGKTYRLTKLVALVPSVIHHEPERQAARLSYLASYRGFDQLRTENRAAWTELWKARVKIKTKDKKWQRIADACFYYVHSSIHPASPCSTSLFGLTQWNNYHFYRGHVFWDVESFTYPSLIVTHPESARAILEYRFKHLDAARNNALMNGYKGLLFPWESSPLHGEEVTPNAWGRVNMHEHHISLDIAHAFALYAHATGDETFMRERAWTVLYGVSEWIASRVIKTERGYETHHITGISEGNVVNNNIYVNAGISVVLKETLDMAAKLHLKTPAVWKDIQEKIYIPIDKTTGIPLSWDGWNLNDGCCPEILSAMSLFGYKLDAATEAKAIKHYVSKANYGMPMCYTNIASLYARTGDRSGTLKFLEKGVLDYIFEPYCQINEFGSKKIHGTTQIGPYLAHAGGFLQSLIFGFTGLHLNGENPDTWAQHPIVLPEGWEGIEIDRIYIREKAYRLTATQGQAKAQLMEIM